MFRYTVTFLLIFLVINHDFAAARSVEFAPQTPVEQLQKRNVVEKDLKVKETGVVETHSRMKRSYASLFRAGTSLAAGTAFALSTGATIYHAIRKCKDYKPTNCKTPNCHYHSCPDVCKGPDTNRKYVEEERGNLKRKLLVMDGIQRDAFNLATQAISAGLNNKRILAEIDRINQKVDELIFSIAQMDIDLASKFRNNSITIRGLIRNQLLSLDDIVSSGEIQGLFDKWTWEGTGVFVLSLALPLSLTLFSNFRQRYAINQIYKDLRTNFEARFVNQRTNTLNPNAKMHNKFAYVQGLSTNQINNQLKANAKAIYKSDQANQQVSKVEKITTNYITPIINLIVTALSVWSIYSQVAGCIAITNDMQDTAITMAEKADEIEKLKQQQVDPLLRNVTTQAWPNVRGMMTNETTIDWLDGIRNLSLGASNSNATVAAVIQDFMDNIAAASYDRFIALQNELIVALKTIDYEYTCLADKQHAITTVITDCRIGRLPFPELYQYATTKHKLNRASCISKGIFPYTTQAQFFTILNATATHQSWYSNCLLNSDDLLYRVCSEKIKGYVTPKEIVNQVNKTGLTEEMVPNFLGRCPPPKITPKSIIDTCHLYCLYQPVFKISMTVVLLESQVNQIIRTCPICSVSDKDLKKICNLHKCKGENATTIEKDVELPLPTVNFVMANNCSKCNIDDPKVKKTICVSYKCRGYSAAKIAKAVGLIESAVSGILPQCNTIVGDCIDEVTAGEKMNMHFLHCTYKVPAEGMVSFFKYKVEIIRRVLALQPCPTSNGLDGFPLPG